MRTRLRAMWWLLTMTTAGALMIAAHAQTPADAYDVLIRGGRIVDGTGNPWFSGDVGIRGNRIAAVGPLRGASARRVIDAAGLVVAPGFIDLHTHSDLALLQDGTAQSKVRQGVTTDVTGEGTSVAPRDGLEPESGEGGIRQDWTNFTGYFDRLKQQGISMNLVAYVSYQTVRRVVMGYTSRPATPAEIERMTQLVARSMEEGTWGMVARFDSGGPAHPDEIIELTKVVGAYSGTFTSHIGSEGYNQDRELDFVIRLARETRVPVHIFHFKIRAPENWPRMQHFIDRVAAARAEGLDVTANQYPYTAMNHGWNDFFPLWAKEGGPAAFAKRLQDPAVRERIKKDRDFLEWSHEHGGWDGIVYARASHAPHRKYEGMRLAQIAKLRGDADPAETCVQLMAEAGGNIGGVFHTMSEENVRLVMRQPWVAIASDAGALNVNASGFPHPRAFGTAARVLGYYVREQKVLTLEDAVRKMSSYPAQILGLQDRGEIRPGLVADIVVFDPGTVRDTATFEQPKSYAVGVPYVLVGGELVIDKGEHTGARPGAVLYGRAHTTR
ncbi:MAG: D-aminoacylase [Acidobacteria bacterium]|nr:D-aminoacylase [Acidobacteriota bacterium]